MFDYIDHPVSTCRMGTGPMAVGDPRLGVLGVDGLWGVDASILSANAGGHT